MRVLSNSYLELVDGQIVELSGRSLNDINFLGMKEYKKEELKINAKQYGLFTCGGRAFTINGTEENMPLIESLKTPSNRAKLAYVRLTARTAFLPEIDAETGDATGGTIERKTFEFTSSGTIEDTMAMIQAEGKLASEERKYQDQSTKMSDIKRMLADASSGIEGRLSTKLNDIASDLMAVVNAKSAAPVAAGLDETVEGVD